MNSNKDVFLYCLMCVAVGIMLSYFYWTPKFAATGIQSLKKDGTIIFKDSIIDSQRKTIEGQRVLIQRLLEVLKEEENRHKTWSSYEQKL